MSLKSKSRVGTRSKAKGRGFNIPAASPLAALGLSPSPSYLPSLSIPTLLKIARSNSVDDRLFYPARARHLAPARTIWGYKAPVKIKVHSNPYKRNFLHDQRSFTVPAKTAICIRRKQRKEVLLALGKGGGNHRGPRRGRYSDIWC